MLVYLTRPPNYEVLSRGLDHVKLWVQEPAYFHEPDVHDATTDASAGLVYHDRGWVAPYSAPTSAKFMIKQDRELVGKVMRKIWESMLPVTTVLGEGQSVFDWLDAPYESKKISNLHALDWDQLEFKGKIAYTRFLLEVDLRSNCIRQLNPLVYASYGSFKGKGYALSNGTGFRTTEVPEDYRSCSRYPYPKDCEQLPF